MSFKDEITKAIGAHGMWKARLRAAIDTGKLDASVADVRKDNGCAFGQWLYGATIPAAAKASPDYTTVKGLHAKFHECAAKVLELASKGAKAEANKLMDGEYATISSQLTAAMMKWTSSSAAA